MDPRGEIERKGLFDLYSKQLELYDSRFKDVFFCPICTRGFSREALTGPNPALSLAHVIPKSLGGRLCTLSCTQCNNDNGHEIETFLVERFRQDDWKAGIGTIPARLAGPFGSIGVTFGLDPNTQAWKLNVQKQQTSPNDFDELLRFMNENVGKSDVNVEFNIRGRMPHDSTMTENAIYQSAFLLMFTHFGYEFIVHEHFAPLRQQILQPRAEIYRPRILLPTDEAVAFLLGQRAYSVFFSHQPAAIFACMRMARKGGLSQALVVALPGLDSPILPDFETGTFRGDRLPLIQEALAVEKRLMYRLWKHTQLRQKRS
jgi:HNH endonuclease